MSFRAKRDDSLTNHPVESRDPMPSNAAMAQPGILLIEGLGKNAAPRPVNACWQARGASTARPESLAPRALPLRMTFRNNYPFVIPSNARDLQFRIKLQIPRASLLGMTRST